MKFLAAEISGREGGNLSVVQIVSSCYPDSLYDVFRWFLYSVRNSLNESSETSEQTMEATPPVHLAYQEQSYNISRIACGTMPVSAG